MSVRKTVKKRGVQGIERLRTEARNEGLVHVDHGENGLYRVREEDESDLKSCRFLRGDREGLRTKIRMNMRSLRDRVSTEVVRSKSFVPL